ncbi:hypothetical protein AAY473_026266 [Plecturocebus cupreus]
MSELVRGLSLTLLPGLESSGIIMDHCSLNLPGSNDPPALAGSYCVTQASVQWLFTGVLEKERARRLIHNYNLIYNLSLSPRKIDQALRRFRSGENMLLEPALRVQMHRQVGTWQSSAEWSPDRNILKTQQLFALFSGSSFITAFWELEQRRFSGLWRVSKSITSSTDFRLVYLECMELACQTSALAIKHAMVTIALPCVSATRIGNNHKCQKRERMEKESCAKSSGKMTGLAAPLQGPRQLHLLLPLLGAGELMPLWPPVAPSVDPFPCIIHPLLPPTLENVPCLCQNNICAPASLRVMDKPASSSPDPGGLWVKTPH